MRSRTVHPQSDFLCWSRGSRKTIENDGHTFTRFPVYRSAGTRINHSTIYYDHHFTIIKTIASLLHIRVSLFKRHHAVFGYWDLKCGSPTTRRDITRRLLSQDPSSGARAAVTERVVGSLAALPGTYKWLFSNKLWRNRRRFSKSCCTRITFKQTCVCKRGLCPCCTI